MTCDLVATPGILGSTPHHGSSSRRGEWQLGSSSGRWKELVRSRSRSRGRISGRQITIPVWFVQDGGTLFLLPVRGPDADWYRNLVKNPTIHLAVDGAEHTTRVTPMTEPTRVSDVVDRFRAKYGSRDVEAYYSRPEVAVEVPLT